MKLSLLITFLIVGSYVANAQVVEDEEFLHYLIRDYKGNIIDVRSDEVVSNEPSVGFYRLVNEDLFIYKGASNTGVYIQFYNSKFEKGELLRIDGKISPNWKYVIKLKDGDLYRADIDYQNKVIGSYQKVTELGILRGSHVNFSYWYDDVLIIKPTNNPLYYHLNTRTKEISEVDATVNIGMSTAYNSLSPNGRYVVLEENNDSYVMGFAVYDILTNSVKQSSINPENGYGRFERAYWHNDSVYTVLYPTTEKYTEVITKTLRSTTEIKFRIDHPKPSILLTFDEVNSVNTSIDRYPPYTIGYYKISSKVLRFTTLEKNNINFYDLISGESIDFRLDRGEWTPIDNMNGDMIRASWMSQNRLLFILSGDILGQGTFIYDLEANEREKVSSYESEDIIILPQIKHAILVLDGKICLVDIDGNVSELNSVNYYRGNFPQPVLERSSIK